MGHMAVGLVVVIGWIEMKRLEMAGSWTLWIGEVTDTGTIIVLVMKGTMIVIIIILIGGVIGDIFWVSLRK